MPILFSAVANGNRIVVKYALCDGNFMEIANEVLRKVPYKNEKMTYAHGHYLLNYIVENHHLYICITDKSCQRSRSFLYLNEIKRRFTVNHGDAFCKVLANEMYRYNEDYNTIVIRKGELDELNNIGVGESESLLGEKILFVNNPEELSYRVTFLQAKNAPQTPLLEETAKQSFEIYSEPIENATDSKETCKTLSRAEAKLLSENKSKSFRFLFYIIFIVVLVIIWLVMSNLGPIPLVAVAFICVMSFAQFSKGKHKI